MMCNRITDWSTVVNERHGKLTVLSLAGKNKFGHMTVKCKCDCGNIIISEATRVVHDKTLSCGCLQKEIASSNNRVHGMTNTRLHRIWSAMISRCENPKNNRYYAYGAKGISVCDEWRNDFLSFYDWAIHNGYTDELSIDRIDNSIGYCTSNCRWSTKIQQANNKTTNRFITYCGQTKTVKQWSQYFGFDYKYFHEKLKECNWNIEKLLEIPYFKEKLKCV